MAMRIDWYYRRNGCETCRKSDAYLGRQQAKIARQIDARKERITPSEALSMARGADQLWVARGRAYRHFDMKHEPPSDQELRKLLIGPSGNLRAPAILQGRCLLIGFHREAYDLGLVR